MRILQINTVYGEGSTGKIAKDIHDACKAEGMECISAYRCDEKGKTKFEDTVAASSFLDSRIHGRFSKYTMFKGFFSFFKTLRFIEKAKKYSPDIIHLHNLHGSYINIPLLFRYIKKHNIPVVWTFHDCWPFTAICSHFDLAGCKKWENGCKNCPQRKDYSSCPVDFTGIVWKLKKKYFNLPERMTIVTPSDWLNGLVGKSFLKKYPAVTVNNGIDLEVFRYSDSGFRKKYGLENKTIVLGVAFGWGYEKGLDVFSALSERLPEEYKIVLVGIDEETRKKLSPEIISINRTYSHEELAEIYSAADIFVNPTREEVLGLTNIEALACGTPVITFRTGGSPECIDETCGIAVEKDDVDSIEKFIRDFPKEFCPENCRKRAEQFGRDKMIEKYIDIYKQIMKEKNLS